MSYTKESKESKETNETDQDKAKAYFEEAMEMYLKLKEEYTIEVDLLKQNIFSLNPSQFSWKDKRKIYRSKKAKCVQCRRAVGCIFETKVEPKEHVRQWLASCGDKKDPCTFSIALQLGTYSRIDLDLSGYNVAVEELKKQIIMEKNDILFAYKTNEQGVKEFDAIKEKLDTYMDFIAFFKESYALKIHSVERLHELDSLERRFYVQVQEYKTLMEEYEKTKERQYVKDAVRLYVESIQDLWQKRNEKKYVYMGMEPKEKDKVIEWVQVPYERAYSLLEYDLDEPKVIRFHYNRQRMKQSGVRSYFLETQSKENSNEKGPKKAKQAKKAKKKKDEESDDETDNDEEKEKENMKQSRKGLESDDSAMEEDSYEGGFHEGGKVEETYGPYFPRGPDCYIEGEFEGEGGSDEGSDDADELLVIGGDAVLEGVEELPLAP
jgi:hypothetical protein